MKEKTFEELIEEKLTATKEGYVVYSDDIKELLQQVREATIAECIDKISELHGLIYKGAYQEHLASNLPVDRIKLTEK